MHDQRIETGPTFGLINPRNRLTIAGIRTQPVNRLGRESDQLAVSQQLRRILNASPIRLQKLRYTHVMK